MVRLMLVVDCSLIIATLFADERTPPALAARERVMREGGVAPALWWLEVANTLLFAERRGRASREDRMGYLRDLASLPIMADDETTARAWTTTIALAARYGLTSYDAAYLELALRRGLPLASLDADLNAAAERSGVEVLIARGSLRRA